MFVEGDVVQLLQVFICHHYGFESANENCPTCERFFHDESRLLVTDVDVYKHLIHVFNLITHEREVWAPTVLGLVGEEE